MIAVTKPAPREPWWMRDLAGQPRFTVPFGCFDDYPRAGAGSASAGPTSAGAILGLGQLRRA